MAVTVVEKVQEVKIHFCPGVFVRHIKDESVIWCPCSGGCTMLRDSRPFLEEIAGEWRGVDEIVRAVAAKFDCKEDAVRGDFAQILDELRSQNFVECEIGDNAFYVTTKTVTTLNTENEVALNYDWLGDFNTRA